MPSVQISQWHSLVILMFANWNGRKKSAEREREYITYIKGKMVLFLYMLKEEHSANWK